MSLMFFRGIFQRIFNKHMTDCAQENRVWNDLTKKLNDLFNSQEELSNIANSMVNNAILTIEKVIISIRKEKLVIANQPETKGLRTLYSNLCNANNIQEQIKILSQGQGVGFNSGWNPDLKNIFQHLDNKIKKDKTFESSKVKTKINVINDLEALINEIPENMTQQDISEEVEKKIHTAYEIYLKLDKGCQENISNKEKLTDAVKMLEASNIKIKSVFDLINNIDEKNILGCKEKIEIASSEFENLSEYQKMVLQNKQKLMHAEGKLNSIIEKTKKVNELIENANSEFSNIGRKAEQLIIKAREAYKDLSEEECTQVQNKNTLFSIETELQKINKFIVSVDHIGNNIKLSSETKINEAKIFYESICSQQQSKLTEYYNKIIQSELKIKQLHEGISNFKKLIEEIEEPVALESEQQIDNAIKEYNNLTDEQKDQVSASSQKLLKVKGDLNKLKRVNEIVILFQKLPSIENIKLEHEGQFDEVNQKYLCLNDEQKEQIQNIGRNLLEIDEKFKELKFLKSVREIDLRKEESISNAEGYYNKLNKNQQDLSNVKKEYEKLIEFQNKLDQQKKVDKFKSLYSNILKNQNFDLKIETEIDEALNYSNLISENSDEQDNNQINELLELKKVCLFIRSVENIGVKLKKDNYKDEDQYGIRWVKQCEKQIKKAEQRYEELNEKQHSRDDVMNAYTKLKKAHNEYETLKKTADEFVHLVEQVELKIESMQKDNRLIEKKDELKQEVDTLVAKYETLNKDQQKEIDESYERLLRLQEKIQKITNPVESFINTVKKIGEKTITLECQSKTTEAEEDYNKLTHEQKEEINVKKSAERLNAIRQKLNCFMENEKTMNKLKNDLKKIKEPLKDLSKFQESHPDNFESAFSSQLLHGFNLCMNNDLVLIKEKNDLRQITINQEASICKKLFYLCDKEGIANVSKNYLLFMVSLIKCAKYYIDLKESDKKIEYEDPQEYLVHRNFDAQKEELEEKIKNHELKMTHEEKYLINNLVKINTFEMKNLQDEKVPRSIENQISLLEKAYEYLYPYTNKPDMKWIKDEWEKWKKFKKDDNDEQNRFENKSPNKVIEKIIKSVEEARDKWKKENPGKEYHSTEIQNLCIKALKVASNDIQRKSFLKKCLKPMWKIKDGHPNITINDLKQGDLGDCWLISSLISIVKDTPDNILRCFPNRENEISSDGKIIEDKNGNGNITVRLYKIVLHGHKKDEGRIRAYARPICPIDIKMKNTVFTNGNKSDVAWPRFIEKAVSVYRSNNLAVIDTSLGNYGGIILNQSTMWNQTKKEKEKYGHKSVIGGNTADGVALAMILGTTAGGSNTTYMIGERKVKTLFREYLKKNLDKFKNKIVQVSFTQDFEVNGKLVITNHAYSLDNVNNNYAIITNPWNNEDEDSEKSTIWEKSVKIPIDTFCKYCRRINFGVSKKETF